MNKIGRTELEIKLIEEMEKMPTIIAQAVESAFYEGHTKARPGKDWDGPFTSWLTSDSKAKIDKGMEAFSEEQEVGDG